MVKTSKGEAIKPMPNSGLGKPKCNKLGVILFIYLFILLRLELHDVSKTLLRLNPQQNYVTCNSLLSLLK